MGYFSNGTESEDYEAKYCSKCAHQYGPDGNCCVVWLAHIMRNYDECNNPDSILHMLIPRSDDGLGNEKCHMFIAKADRDAEAAWNRRAAPTPAVPEGWRDALEHVTELLVDTWHHQMDGDPEELIAVKDARALLAAPPAPEGDG